MNKVVLVERVLPLLGVLAFLAIGAGLRPLLHRAWYGSSGITVVGRRRQRPAWIERGALVLPVVLLLEAAVACTPSGYAALGSLAPASWRGPLAVVGFATMLAGTVAMFVAQLAMGASWRIGIDRVENPGLVTGGPYRFSRNPIYLCMFVVLAGFVAALPGWPTIVTFVATVLGIRLAVAREEDHLASVYGDAYRAYARRVGRFLPHFGR
jgi:protein-S-isoprenylcysteine O-methyltransferase Ste14